MAEAEAVERRKAEAAEAAEAAAAEAADVLLELKATCLQFSLVQPDRSHEHLDHRSHLGDWAARGGLHLKCNG